MDEQDIDPKEGAGENVPEDIERMMLDDDEIGTGEDPLEGDFSY